MIPRYTRRSRMVRRILMLADELAALDPAYRRPSLAALTPLAMPQDAEVERYGKALARRVEQLKEQRKSNAT